MEISDEEEMLYLRWQELQAQKFSPNKELEEKIMQWRIDMDEYRSRL